MVTAHLDNEKFEKQTETNAGSGEVKKGILNYNFKMYLTFQENQKITSG